VTRWGMKIIEYETIELLKQSEKSAVHLVREKGGEQVFIRKELKGRQNIYWELQSCPHPYLPKLYEALFSGGVTTVIEEYIEGPLLSAVELSEKQVRDAARELCCVLEFLHGKGIIHRDIKPSNILLARDGHIRLIDFDAARMPKKDLEQDTRLLGTRGYAPPEQYGFAQTDGRTDVYSLGVTLKQLLGERAQKLRYRRVLQRCTNLNPDKRYPSVRRMERAFFYERRCIPGAAALLLLLLFLWLPGWKRPPVLPAPENPRWDGETGIALWGNVPDSGDNEVAYSWRLYWKDTVSPPTPEEQWLLEGRMSGNGGQGKDFPIYEMNLSPHLKENGVYYFSVSATGDGVHFTDSPYALSDAFAFTGASAPPLPMPEGLAWEAVDTGLGWVYYATWSNLDDYADTDSFNVTVYDQNGGYVINNIWTKAKVLKVGYNGIQIQGKYFAGGAGKYRFTVQAQTSRPNLYRSSPKPIPTREEFLSPWLTVSEP
jgi:predicted Ser/Thr protein kinase